MLEVEVFVDAQGSALADVVSKLHDVILEVQVEGLSAYQLMEEMHFHKALFLLAH